MRFPIKSRRKKDSRAAPSSSSPSRRWLVLWGTAVALLVAGALSGCQLRESARLARQSEPLQRAPDQPRMRLLIVGDSTGVGTGASSAQGSVAGLLAQAFPALWIENRSRDGAKFADMMAQLEADDQRFDMVLVQGGGNDVIRLRTQAAMASDVQAVIDKASMRAGLVVVMPAGNVGNAPFFFAPVSWLMTHRSRQMHAAVRAAAVSHNAVYVNLFHERERDPFVLEPGLNATDGLHPSDAGYRVWFNALMAQAELPRHLAAARSPPQ